MFSSKQFKERNTPAALNDKDQSEAPTHISNENKLRTIYIVFIN